MKWENRWLNPKKDRTPQQILKDECDEMVYWVEHWKDEAANGCSDPNWSDGDNMNLARDHIIYRKYFIKKLCDENGWEIPECYFIPTPPEVTVGYMAKLKSKDSNTKERIRNLLPHYQKGTYSEMTDKLPEYKENQLELF